MPRQQPLRWPFFAFLCAAFVPFGLIFGPISLVSYLNASLHSGGIGLLIAWVLVVFVGTTVLNLRAPVGIARILPAMVAGIVSTFGGIQVAVWRTLSVITMFFGTVALVLIVAGCFFGTMISGRGTLNGQIDSDLARAGVIVVALSFLPALVSGTAYWFQDVPGAYSAAFILLLVTSPLVGFVPVWRENLLLWIFLPLLAALPFVVVVTSIVTAPVALIFDLPPGGLLTIDDAAIELAILVTIMAGVGAILARGIRYLNLKNRVVTGI